MDYLVFIGAAVAVFIILKILAWPIKKIIKMLINILIGGLLLVLVNYVGAYFNFALAINWISALTVGILGIPGLIILIILHFILKKNTLTKSQCINIIYYVLQSYMHLYTFPRYFFLLSNLIFQEHMKDQHNKHLYLQVF